MMQRRWLAWGPGLLTLVLCAGMLVSVISQGILFYQEWHRVTPVASAASPTASHQSQVIAFDDSSGFLFGQYTGKIQSTRQESLPETTLSLSLDAIIYSDTEHASAVFIHDGSRSSLFRVNDLVAGEAMVVGIYPDFVTLERDGRSEKLLYSRAAKFKPVVEREGQLAAKTATAQSLLIDQGREAQGEHVVQRLASLRERYLKP